MFKISLRVIITEAVKKYFSKTNKCIDTKYAIFHFNIMLIINRDNYKSL